MTGAGSKLEAYALILIGLLVVANTYRVVRIWNLKRSAEAGIQLLRDRPTIGVTPPPDGYTAQGTPVRVELAPAGCWVVRYESAACHFCRADDQNSWGRLAPALRQMGCVGIVLLPQRRDDTPGLWLNSEAGAFREALVNMEWAKRFRLTIEPTTLAFGANRQLVWYREGELLPTDERAAIRAVTAANAKSLRNSRRTGTH